MSSCASGSCKPSTPYYKYRYVVFAIITALSLITPFITINGNHIFLLSFDKKHLELMGVAFDMQEFYLLPFLLMFFFIFIFAITAVGGRIWCGWGCPQTIFRTIYRDLIEGKLLGMRRRTNKQKPIDYSKNNNRLKKIVAILIWSALALVAASNFTWYFVPPEDFFEYIKNPAEHTILVGMVLIIAALLIYDVTKLGEDFCIYVCPYVRIQSSMYDKDTIYTIYDEKRGGKIYDDEGNQIGKKPLEEDAECVGCDACVIVCPTGIDIRKGLQLECINCLECADACTKVMAKFDKPSLINWESSRSSQGEGKTKFVRFRTVAYSVILAAILVILFVMSGTKETMLLNINKSNRIYKIENVDNINRVSNDYVFLFSNTSNKDHQFFFEITDHDGVLIERPSEPFPVKAGEKVKKIVVLYTDKDLSEDPQKDTRVPLNVRAYATDDESVFVNREAIFVYPPKSKLD